MGAVLDKYMLNAKLPLLGPLIGATEPAGAGLGSRIWIQVDNTQNEPPMIALTALWDLEKKCVCPGTARAWKLTVALPTNTTPSLRLHFAVARVEFPRTPDRCVIRMVSLHRRAGSDAHVQFPSSTTCRIDDAAPVNLSRQAASVAQAVVAGEPLPEPAQVTIVTGFPDLRQDLDALAEEAFADIAAELARTARNVREPIRTTRSRWALNPRSIDECEADLAAGARSQFAKADGDLVFAATCCRHPGMGWDSERAEETFKMLGEESRKAAGPAFALLTGDQIYADATAGAFDVADRFEKFSVRYEEAFGARRFRCCASRLPLYMVADDHEIEDNWSLSRLQEAHVPEHQRMRRRRLAAWAQMMFIAYQRLHGPRSPELKRSWYEIKAAGVPFFVMDTRFERYAWGDKHAPQICNCAQRRALLAWLDEMQELDAANGPLSGVPKFIVSGSVFAPGLEEFARDPASARRADNWQAFPGMRAALIKAIVRRKLRNVVFLSGDYHCGAVAALELPDSIAKTTYPAYAIVSPPAYAPFPFANVRAAEVAGDEALADPRGAGRPPCARIKAEATEGEGYVEIRVARDARDWSVEVRYLGLGFKEPNAGRPFARRLAGGRIQHL